MSIFKTKGIVLKVKKIKDSEFLYTIFTKDYGKILCNKKIAKKEKTIDLGYIINFEIYTKENVSIHKIRNIKIVSEFNMENKKFSELNNYLILLSLILTKTPKGSPVYEIFDLLETINNYKDIDEIKLILAKLKVLSIFGELGENNENKVVNKIIKFINSSKIERILKLKGIDQNLKSILENIT